MKTKQSWEVLKGRALEHLENTPFPNSTTDERRDILIKARAEFLTAVPDLANFQSAFYPASCVWCYPNALKAKARVVLRLSATLIPLIEIERRGKTKDGGLTWKSVAYLSPLDSVPDVQALITRLIPTNIADDSS